MSDLTYKVEPVYCGDCVKFRGDEDGEGVCIKDGAETWHGEIGCKDFERREDEDNA